VRLKRSSLEFVLNAITNKSRCSKEQHTVLLETKLRIPDIYENESNQRAFGGSSRIASRRAMRTRSSARSCNWRR